MTRWTVLLLPVVLACREPTAPTVDCQGRLEVTITVTRFGTDTTVACVFPRDTLPPPPPPPPDDDCDDDHGHGHGRHHKHGHHDHGGHHD